LATILYVSTYGSDDPTRATLPFVAALGALEAGHNAQIFLAGEATFLMKDVVAEQVHGVGWPPMKELLHKAIAQNIRIYV
jgi:predicted peroxiredoxin